MSSSPLVSCLCITHRRLPMLKRAIFCFLKQTYPARELLIVYQSDDELTRTFLSQLGMPSIRSLMVEAGLKMNTGQLRNLALQNALGDYVATWDDDDLHAPTRLAEQIDCMNKASRHGCALGRIILYDEVTQSAYLSARRTWEGSLVACRESMPLYGDLERGEDLQVVETMLAKAQLAELERPNLYVYVYHGANTWNRTHWEQNLLPNAQLLSHEYFLHLKALIDASNYECDDSNGMWEMVR